MTGSGDGVGRPEGASSDSVSPSVYEAILSIRDFVNRDRVHGELFQDRSRFRRTCAALDTLEDADRAVVEFFARPRAAAVGYHQVYGVLQAFTVQQDTVNDLLSSLELPSPVTRDSAMKELRRVRNAVFHPTNYDHGRKTGQIDAGTLSREGFTLQIASLDADGPPTWQSVDLIDLAARQQAALACALSDALADLHEREREHRRDHRSESLSALLGPSWRYQCQKVAEFAHEGAVDSIVPARVAHGVLKASVERVEEALRERGLGPDRNSAVGWLFDELDSTLDAVRRRLTVPCQLDAATVLRALAHEMSARLTELSDLLRDLDREYASDEIG